MTEILKPCSPATCPMRAVTCNYLLDFNPKFDKVRTQWARARKEVNGDVQAAQAVDEKFMALIQPILDQDVVDKKAKCKADLQVPFNEHLSLDQIAAIFGISRPRVQQIEVRAKGKIAELKQELVDVIGTTEEESE